MNTQEFLSLIKSRGATLFPAAPNKDVPLLNASLQKHRLAMLPSFLSDLYQHVSCINLGNGYIFGPTETSRTGTPPVPGILQVNTEISPLGLTPNKTIFGRNDLFWFAYDTFGTCYMLDNLTLRPLRKYQDPYRAITDCLIAGKF